MSFEDVLAPDQDAVRAALASVEDGGEVFRLALVRLLREPVEALVPAVERWAAAGPQERELAAELLGALGAEEFGRVGVSLLRALISDDDSRVASAGLVAVGRGEWRDARDTVLAARGRPEGVVRATAALALSALIESPAETDAIDALIRLSRDADEHVREMATFALGAGSAFTTDEMHAALRERAGDESDAVRCEAVEALGILGDLDALAAALAGCDVRLEAVMAAQAAADPRLHAPLLALQQRGYLGCAEDLDAALEACRGDGHG